MVLNQSQEVTSGNHTPLVSYLTFQKPIGTPYSKTALHSFDEELATYELLDLDAQGENDDEVVDADDITRDFLIG